ncbi:hypothetical protein JJC04_02260 [Flavobacterium covae]|nr:hypothetical protein [Flavobacterium covae]QYS91625.1 hypothetical protein JJC04_02260 [Flavobacterium covae]
MTNIEQLDYVKKYFQLYDWHKKIKTPEDIYLQVFAPIGINKDDDFVLYQRFNNPKNKTEEQSNKNYIANKSVDEENNNDGKIQRSEILTRYKTSFTEGLQSKESDFKCGLIKEEKKIDSEAGVLEDMKQLVSKHIPYSQAGVRNSMSEKGLKALDCSETVAIYLYKLGITNDVKLLSTLNMTTQKDFRTAIGSQNIDFVANSQNDDFKPQKGDIFVWRRSDGVGHTELYMTMM